MSVEVMKQALEALENAHGYLPVKTGVERDVDQAITALRQAIQFAEMVEKGTKAWADTPDDWVDDLRGDGAEQTAPSQKPGKWVYPDCPETYSQTKLECARLKQSEQKPVAWREIMGKWQTHYYDYNDDGRGEPLYTAPPKKEWAGLTRNEAMEIINSLAGHDWRYAVDAIEAKLKERNG